MSGAGLVELVGEVVDVLLRDPRVHPRVGDVVDDDPPLVPLTVVEVWPSEDVPATVVAERREVWPGQVVVRGRWRGTLGEWRSEMVKGAAYGRQGPGR